MNGTSEDPDDELASAYAELDRLQRRHDDLLRRLTAIEAIVDGHETDTG
jgi:hypothetical protein